MEKKEAALAKKKMLLEKKELAKKKKEEAAKKKKEVLSKKKKDDLTTAKKRSQTETADSSKAKPELVDKRKALIGSGSLLRVSLKDINELTNPSSYVHIYMFIYVCVYNYLCLYNYIFVYVMYMCVYISLAVAIHPFDFCMAKKFPLDKLLARKIVGRCQRDIRAYVWSVCS